MPIIKREESEINILPAFFLTLIVGGASCSPMDIMEKIASLAKRRGFVFQSSEIYGGLNGFWDYGPMGCELKNRIKNFWWQRNVRERHDVEGLDTSIIAHPMTWVASGHVSHFSDPMVDCKGCKRRFRLDEIAPGSEGKLTTCPECGGVLTDPKQFNLMFKTFVGAVENESSQAYLRPETCQSIFTQFKNVLVSSRQKIPFGIAQIGKSFRNEITPRNFIFRSREFEQMEMEFFIHPKENKKWFQYWLDHRMQWFYDLGIRKDKLRLRPHAKDELAHYAQGCSDVEYEFPFGWSELEGIADRGNYDLSQHINTSKKDLSYFDDETKEKYVPAVIEISLGVDRTFLTILCDAYHEEEVNGELRTVMRFAPHMAPYTAAFFPLSKKLEEPVQKLEMELRKEFATDFDGVGSIGKRYRRHDEIGTPFCITYDFQSEEDKKVTVRHRDSMRQDRIAMDQVSAYLKEHRVKNSS